MKASIVIGANFGDEGKGLMTDYLCSKADRPFGRPLVVRFNGGGQAGHTVVTPYTERHVFNHFGSGFFSGAATFLSRHFIVHPGIFLKELVELHSFRNYNEPMIFIHELASLTTPFDVFINQFVEQSRGAAKHGSCGIGINETVKRNFNPEFCVHAKDMLFRKQLLEKLHKIHGVYVPLRLKELGIETLISKYFEDTNVQDVVNRFVDSCESMVRNSLQVKSICDLDKQYDELVFEGAQGLLLDEDHYFFPNVTRSKTGLHNALQILDELEIKEANVFYMTRSYLTRHGAGPLPFELSEKPYKMIVDETNIDNPHQGTLRFAPLNIPLLCESIGDDLGQKMNVKLKSKLMVTCMDQSPMYRVMHEGEHHILGQDELIKLLKKTVPVDGIGASFGPTRSNVVENLLLG